MERLLETELYTYMVIQFRKRMQASANAAPLMIFTSDALPH
ncbi:MAG TPA: hypothetical protein VNR87_08445 [Flavisolibacter sp.]|nr:hypothetical protein [Flavisolibacter sp.]